MTAIEDARAEAFKRYDGDRVVSEVTGEEESFDDWGYAETARQAFVAGVEWTREALTAPPTDDEREALRKQAREHIEKKRPSWHDNGVGIVQGSHYRSGFVDGAEWAGLRRQGPITDAAVEAAAKRFWLAGHPCEAWPPTNEEPEFLADRYRFAARAALRAAEGAR